MTFPEYPSVDDIYELDSRQYIWNGYRWNLYKPTSSGSGGAIVNVAGKTGAVVLDSNDVSGIVRSASYQKWTSAPFFFSGSRQLTPVFGQNKFVVVVTESGGNVVYSSPDGVFWTQSAFPTANTAHGATGAYGNGLFVFLDSGSNRVFTSPDGVTWTIRTFSASSGLAWRSIAYGNGTFVAVARSNTNKAVTSTDGVTWTERTLSSTGLYNSIAYGNGIFLAPRLPNNNPYTADVLTSPDGITWTTRSLPSSQQWTAVSYGNGTFMACAYSMNVNTLSFASATSPDGITWTARTPPHGVSFLAYTNGNFIAAEAQGYYFVVSATKDWINWTAATAVPDLGQLQLGEPVIAAGNGIALYFPLKSISSNFSSQGANYCLCSERLLNAVYGNQPETICEGGDARLSDARRVLAAASSFAHGNSGTAKTLSATAALQTCSLTGDCTFTLPSAASSNFVLVLTQSASFTATFTGVRWPSAAGPTITTGANKTDIIRFVSDGTSWYGTITQNI